MTLPASIPLRRDAASSSESSALDGSAIAMLALIFILALFAWAWQRKRGTAAKHWTWLLGKRGGTSLSSIAVCRLTPRHSVHEIEWNGRHLLIGCSDQTIAVLAESVPPSTDGPEEAA